ncbi:MAG: phosphoglycerate kinase, partial [Alphaproteobacteria bacterium]|nr:phosphoglycerate kinase [Alphaproteobacteria bacterium]
MTVRSIQNINVDNKFVLLREDFNVQIVDGQIQDTFRIDSAKQTIDYLRKNGAKVVVCSHLGRPKGQKIESLSLKIIADYLEIPFIEDCLQKDFLNSMNRGDVVLLENLRFYSGEDDNDDNFARSLSNGFDIYVNDAFAVSHREAASVVGVAKYLPSYAGLLLTAEIDNISRVLNKAQRPLYAFIGGSKVSSKIGVLKTLATIADKLIIGGAMGTTFLYSRGNPVGNSLFESNMVDTVKDIYKTAMANNCEILLPLDKGVGDILDKHSDRYNHDISDICDTDIIMDDGEQTTKRNIQLLESGKSILWNGTFGLAEWGEKWGYSTFEFAKNLALLT